MRDGNDRLIDCRFLRRLAWSCARQDNIIKDKTRQVLECSSFVVGMTI